jgi:5-formyltetrahydrofolate cyclo-ligase
MSPSQSHRGAQRRELRQRRLAISPRQRRKAAQSLCHQLTSMACVQRARHIAAYAAYGSELSLEAYLRYASTLGKAIYRPKIVRQRMAFLRDAGDLYPHRRFGIGEPPRGRTRPPWAMDIILLPLLGFDLQGNRLGQGGGYYDRCLAGLSFRRPTLIGIAYDCQQIDTLQTAHWDIPLDAVVTPTRTLQFGP